MPNPVFRIVVLGVFIARLPDVCQAIDNGATVLDNDYDYDYNFLDNETVVELDPSTFGVKSPQQPSKAALPTGKSRSAPLGAAKVSGSGGSYYPPVLPRGHQFRFPSKDGTGWSTDGDDYWWWPKNEDLTCGASSDALFRCPSGFTGYRLFPDPGNCRRYFLCWRHSSGKVRLFYGTCWRLKFGVFFGLSCTGRNTARCRWWY